jgi:chromosomal replication initiation ATPase DnaA
MRYAPPPCVRSPLAGPDVIEQAVTRVFGVDQSDLRRVTRGRARVALARQVAMYLAHVACGLSLTETGRLFGRDRTTVAHACGVVEDRRDDPVFDRALDLLEWAVPSLAARSGQGPIHSW